LVTGEPELDCIHGAAEEVRERDLFERDQWKFGDGLSVERNLDDANRLLEANLDLKAAAASCGYWSTTATTSSPTELGTSTDFAGSCTSSRPATAFHLASSSAGRPGGQLAI